MKNQNFEALIDEIVGNEALLIKAAGDGIPTLNTKVLKRVDEYSDAMNAGNKTMLKIFCFELFKLLSAEIENDYYEISGIKSKKTVIDKYRENRQLLEIVELMSAFIRAENSIDKER